MPETNDYTVQRLIHAPRELVFQLLTSLNGLSNWLKRPRPLLEKGVIRFSLNGSDEVSKIRIDISDPPALLQWSIINDTGFGGNWNGTIILFDLIFVNPGSCILHFRHIGLTRDLPVFDESKLAWEHFLRHLIDACEIVYQH